MTQQQIQGVQQIVESQQQSKQGCGGRRPLSILPSTLRGVQGQNNRPASYVSTQTVHGVQATVHVQVIIVKSCK